ncbi:MAG: molybdate ABC transporter substrate-binding protein [Chloroflexales bacterium]|nr:molybdate ABC transporter substrate-binding protein [Chloroflexales bacterium]
MRRSPMVLLTLLLTLLLAACGGAPAAQAPTSPPAPTTEPTAAVTTAATDATTAATPAATAAAPTTAPTTAAGTTLYVFAAASLTDAFKALAPTFEAAHPGVTVVYNFAGAQQLAAQINEGAPADVFASANKKQMDAVIASSKVISGTEHTFVRNRLVVITPQGNPAGITSLKDLAKPGLKLVFEAKEVPAGQYTLDVLAKASALPEYTESFSATVLANVVSYEDNVRSVLSKIALGEGDAGVVYTTDSATQADKVAEVPIPDDLNVIASYPVAPLATSASPDLAQAFVDFVLSPEAQQVLVSYGFIPVTGDASGAAPTAKPVAVSGLVTTPRSFSADDLKAYSS